jgi:hypothetical protein
MSRGFTDAVAFHGFEPPEVLSGMGGIQIEQSLGARDDHWCAIADAVADVYDALI